MSPKLRVTLLAVLTAVVSPPVAWAEGDVGALVRSEQPVMVTMTERGEVVLDGKVTPLVEVLTYFNALARGSESTARRVLVQAQGAKGTDVAWMIGAVAKAGLQNVQFASTSVAPAVPRDLQMFAGKPQLTRVSLATCRNVGADRALDTVETFLSAARAHDAAVLGKVTDLSVERYGMVPAGAPRTSAEEAATLRKKAEDRFSKAVAVQYYDAEQRRQRAYVRLLIECGDGTTRFLELTLRLAGDHRWRLTGYSDAGLHMVGRD